MFQKLFTIFVFLFLSVPPAGAEPPVQTSAKQAIVMDFETGTILLEKNADEHMPTSSMSKTLTVYLIFEALEKGDLGLDDSYTVSEEAWRMGGSKMFVEVDKQVSIEDLLRGVIVQSGNDATIVLAEGLAGTEAAFADRLNAKAREIGMTNTHFTNASGWPDPDHYSTARDLALMTRALIRHFPEYYKYFAEEEFTYSNITQRNRNPLLYRNLGADGVKTGHTESGGYGLIGSGTQEGRRIILVLNGMEDEKIRAQESAKLLQWGLNHFENRTLLRAGQPVAEIGVALGKGKTVPAALREDLRVTLPRAGKKDFKLTAEYTEPLRAPVGKGQEIGMLRIEVPGLYAAKMPLYAAQTVEKMGFFAGTLAKAGYFFTGGPEKAQ